MNDNIPTPSRTEIRRASAHIFEMLLEWFPDIIQSVDSDGQIIYVNRKATDLLGYTRDELLGMNVRDLYAPEIMEKVEKGFAKLKDSGNLAGIESVICDKEGTRIPVEIRSFAVYDNDGKFVRTFSILRDIRDIKELQNTLIHTSRLAAIGELASCIAHDISNPLAVVKLYGELLAGQVSQLRAEGEEESADRLADAVEGVQKSAEKIEKLVNHLRDFSRSQEAGNELVDLRQTIEDALFMITNKITKGNVEVVRNWPEGESFYVRGSASQLEQVFMNLFSNACDAMTEVPEPTIWIQIERAPASEGSPPMWVCNVSDCGAGIAPEHVENIFKAFYTTKGKGKGTGLGLSITRNIVRRHGGEISVNSVVGRGTTFSIQLPCWVDE